MSQKLKIARPSNFVLLDKHKEKTIGPSETQPNEGITVQELLRRHLSGTLGNIGRPSAYFSDGKDEDLDSPDMEKMKNADLFDQELYINQTKAAVDEMESKTKSRRKAAAEAAAKKLDDERIEQKLRERDEASRKASEDK